MKNITEKNFDIDPDIIATTIYADEARRISESGFEVSGNIKQELSLLLSEFRDFIGLTKNAFFRVDAYFDQDTLYILDINTSFVDGWGNALNFMRATRQKVDSSLLESFPENMYLSDEVYRPEFELCISELDSLGISVQESLGILQRGRTYVYGETRRQDNVFPYDGMRTDNKMNLAEFSRIWRSETVKIPLCITPRECSWEDIPKDSIMKVTSKADIPGLPWKVNIGKPKNGKVGSSLWEQGKMIAQEPVPAYVDQDGRKNQLIFMSSQLQVVAGYVQKSQRDIINDNSTQGPISFT